MDPDSKRRGYVNYPEPLKGPVVPYRNERKENPVIRGPSLVASAAIMEWVGVVRHVVWRNAGFGALRRIRFQIEDYEPYYTPEVVPLPEPGVSFHGTDAVATDKTPLDLTLPAALLPPAPADRFPDTRYYTAADYHALYLAGTVTPTDVARALLPLIRKEVAGSGAKAAGPHAVAWFETREDLVLAAAAASTLRYRRQAALGPLDGVPTAVKDEYDMEGYRTCLGSRNDYTGGILNADDGTNTAWSVRKLQEAGCVILGKLHMVEFGLDTPGNNVVHGTPPNPYHAGYYTGGSSSGAAYAVSAGLVPFALGSDGGGSVRIPAAFCSVYGLKPTHGRLSFKPGQNHCITCACLGPLAADVRTLATVYAVLGQPHPTSPFPPVAPPAILLDRQRAPFPAVPLAPSSSPSPSSDKILGIPEAWFARADPGVQALCRSFVDRLVRDHGYRAVPVDLPFLAEGQTAHAMTVLADAAALLPVSTGLTAPTRILLALGRTTPAGDYVLAQKLRRALVGHLAHLWRAHPGMVLVTPTTACAGWPVRGGASELRWGVSDGDTTLRSMEYVWLANFCGLPSLTLPAGYVVPEGEANAGDVVSKDAVLAAGGRGVVPVGIMMTSEWATEAALLRLGVDAEAIVAERHARPSIWVDVVAEAQAAAAAAAGAPSKAADSSHEDDE